MPRWALTDGVDKRVVSTSVALEGERESTGSLSGESPLEAGEATQGDLIAVRDEVADLQACLGGWSVAGDGLDEQPGLGW